MVTAVTAMSRRTVETIRILGVSGSPHRNRSTSRAVQAALQAAEGVNGIGTRLYELAGKRIKPCQDCGRCSETGRCILKDDFEALATLYREADGVIWGAPVYLMSVPAKLKAALERLINPELSLCLAKGGELARPMKACGVIAVGGHRNGGMELTLTQLIEVCMLGRNVVVPGDIQIGAYLGAACWSGDDRDLEEDGALAPDEIGLACARSVGQRVAEMATIIRRGRDAAQSALPPEYHVAVRTDKVEAS